MKNSRPIFDAVRQGLTTAGITVSSHDTSADVAVIWSMLWSGRMRENQAIWHLFHTTGRAVIVAEVGSLHRNQLWKLSLHRAGREPFYGHGLDLSRPAKLNINAKEWTKSGHKILIALQRSESQQWIGMPPPEQWLHETIDRLRKFTDRPIEVRPHPRQRITMPPGIVTIKPQLVPGTYDDFDFLRSLAGTWALINHNSGPGIQSILNGVPAFVGDSSLAAPVANLDLSKIESPDRPDRGRWLVDLCHTHWTTDEIRTGWPMMRLLDSQAF